MPELTNLITIITPYRFNIIGSISLACFGAWLFYLNATLGEFRTACKKFNSTILTELIGLYPIPTQWPKRDIEIIDILQAKFPALQAAVTEFAYTLPWYKRYFFLKAWRTYRLGKDGRDIDHQYYWQYVPSHGESIENGKHFKHDNRLTYQSNFKLNIDSLLSYAK
ncbi:hypothetical protein GALL_21050 [mine drainage metagenome]|uniref:Uncharacterized protein n=1 Tax=mine drainage metagenome TaxID=410659 RepID=A0A1J5TCP4_9ZZZZ